MEDRKALDVLSIIDNKTAQILDKLVAELMMKTMKEADKKVKND